MPVGTLYLVATPIGNLEDISLRALRVLKEVTLVAAEDTRHTRKLFARYEIHTPLISYHEHSQQGRLRQVVDALARGDVALVSDAGSPLLSDPGYNLLHAALDEGHQATCIPGPSAPITALTLSGLPTDCFLYLGYLPRRSSERIALLTKVERQTCSLLFFEVPHRLKESLFDLASVLGETRQAAVCRELTKVHEDVQRGTLAELSAHYAQVEPRGEITLVIAGHAGGGIWSAELVRQAVQEKISEGFSPSKAAAAIAAASGWNRREVYRMLLEEK